MTWLQRLRDIYKYFIYAWLYPFIQIGLTIYGDKIGKVPSWIYQITLLAFGFAHMPYVGAYMKRKLSFKEAFIFGMLCPFGIWIVLVGLKLTIFSR